MNSDKKYCYDSGELLRYYSEGVKAIGLSRTHEYVNLRLKGMTHEKALEKLKNPSK